MLRKKFVAMVGMITSSAMLASVGLANTAMRASCHTCREAPSHFASPVTLQPTSWSYPARTAAAAPPNHSVPTHSASVHSVPGQIHSVPGRSYSGTIPASALRSDHGRARAGTSNVLAVLNAQRARRGIGALGFDARLQAVAERRAALMASQGLKNHPPGSFAPGTYEGVGWSSSYSPSGVSACFTDDPRMRVAGAAMAVGRDGA
ncbi:MAG: hypothetical protein ACF788_05270 [Novipirellula sp. JB048]